MIYTTPKTFHVRLDAETATLVRNLAPPYRPAVGVRWLVLTALYGLTLSDLDLLRQLAERRHATHGGRLRDRVDEVLREAGRSLRDYEHDTGRKLSSTDRVRVVRALAEDGYQSPGRISQLLDSSRPAGQRGRRRRER